MSKPSRLLVQREKSAQHVMGCVSAARVDCILSMKKQKSWSTVPYYVGRLLPNLIEDSTRDCCPPDSFPSKTVHQRTPLVLRKMAPGKLSGFHCQRSVASKFAGPKPPGLSRAGGNVRGLSQAPSKPKTIVELKEMLQSIWDRLHQELSDNGCERTSKATGGLCCSWGWTRKTFSVTVIVNMNL